MTSPRPYGVELTPAARRQISKLEQRTARRVLVELANLQADPRPPGCRAMVAQPNRWRVRVADAGDYRIVYEIHDQQLLVLVIAVAHRREVYR
ncbi:MAG: type II toxin-antitoxin system RelE/ParE family toxin [Geodermatophilaceae bacterium]|nr:type II toxin-antitoxin system RelE/ParE family toxin [Geodermatophilaceae bacterium]